MEQTHQHAHHRCFAGSIWTEKSEHFTSVNVKGDVFYSALGTIELGKTTQRNTNRCIVIHSLIVETKVTTSQYRDTDVLKQLANNASLNAPCEFNCTDTSRTDDG